MSPSFVGASCNYNDQLDYVIRALSSSAASHSPSLFGWVNGQCISAPTATSRLASVDVTLLSLTRAHWVQFVALSFDSFCSIKDTHSILLLLFAIFHQTIFTLCFCPLGWHSLVSLSSRKSALSLEVHQEQVLEGR